MNTPIVDFVREYGESGTLRLHMPGHKGKPFLGVERLDITEIEGADVLYSASGIIAESRRNASELFGTASTLSSCQGTSLSIRAMLYLAVLVSGGRRKILAARNVHKTFMTAAALLDLDVEWMCSGEDGIISCRITADELDERLSRMAEKPIAFYYTSPDYLGNMGDTRGFARVCRKHGVLLLCDNAHGAYLRFLPESLHPITLGAHMCCDSAHKTLPVLTGGGYLHISRDAPTELCDNGERAMSMFASTSPSYLILQSLDMANAYLSEGYREKLLECTEAVARLKSTLADCGYTLVGDEPLKVTLAPKSRGYTGLEVAEYLSHRGVVCEFADRDLIVFMLTPEVTSCTGRLGELLISLHQREALRDLPPPSHVPPRAMSPREAAFLPSEEIWVDEAVGRVLASENVSCPPAIPIAVCGEEIDREAAALFKYYGIDRVRVVKNKI